MSFNTIGHSFRVSTWGESHGPSIGAVVDGCPPGIFLGEEDIQPFLDARRPGQSRHVTQRRERDQIKILSGVFEGRTTGTPISLLIGNEDPRGKDYDQLKDVYRPGHGDYTYVAKYGHRDPRGGGRASARETAARVAAGAVARKVIPEVGISARIVELGGIPAVDQSDDPAILGDAWERALDHARREGNSLGGIVEVTATGVPAGLGAPVSRKLDADLAGAVMGINAVKAVEIGAGMAAARLKGSDYADPMRSGPVFMKNDGGGIAGGISTGAPIVVRAAFKPTPSIRIPLETIDANGNDVIVETKGRHDPCVAIRGAPVVEAMAAIILADHWLMHRGQCGK